MPQAVIVGGIRTPFVKAGGPMRFTPPQELGRIVAREVLYRINMQPDEVDELVCGNVGTPPDATNVGRVIALNAGIPHDRIAHTVCRNCASGMDAVTQAVMQIQTGQSKTVLAVGANSPNICSTS
jgi:acetyl-CoA C-acetyltransferase/acetyl-CoA acyltransferase